MLGFKVVSQVHHFGLERDQIVDERVRQDGVRVHTLLDTKHLLQRV